MMTDIVKAFVEALLQVLKPRLPGWAYALLKNILDEVVKSQPTVPVAAAPDALKAWVQQLLLDQIAQRVKWPLVAAVLTRAVKAVDGALLDFVWDLAMAKLNNQPTPMMMVPAVYDPISFDDLVEQYSN